ncbi:DNA repair protein rad18 [Exophiala spinifera]|uniref:Postreplication repair E3 ubiquitin-protein ligase RAD18 n=1 Tax=Exophiala spinifera TaxID=91928 RepID=A0A0D2BSY6_9EURO|nr:DNA repair protein rad18 [Exophiala spinifera]KIW21505.1 DNA repair protein rad18 [Exophiala spinifera]
MPEPYEVTDSTDWLPTPLAALAPLDSSLRCRVCKDFFTTPMMTSCSHTFCSLCIRRYLSQEGRCPACRESDQEVKLRRNWVVEELVANFTASRKGLLTFATDAAVSRSELQAADSERPRKRRRIVTQTTTNGVGRRSTRSQTKKNAEGASQQSAPSTQVTIEDSEEGSVYEDDDDVPKSPHFKADNEEPNDGLVACPCCHRRMKETLINAHLDKCVMGESTTPIDSGSSPAPPTRAQNATPVTLAYTQQKPLKQNDRLPFINYNLLAETGLRKKLRDLGIPSHGSKELMRKRHTEWVNLWNANCDSSNPVTKRQLLSDLRVWEDTLGRQMEKPPNTGFMSKDFDRDSHVKSQKSNFDELIKQARQRVSATKEKAPETAPNGAVPLVTASGPGSVSVPAEGDPAAAASLHQLVESEQVPADSEVVMFGNAEQQQDPDAKATGLSKSLNEASEPPEEGGLEVRMDPLEVVQKPATGRFFN